MIDLKNLKPGDRVWMCEVEATKVGDRLLISIFISLEYIRSDVSILNNKKNYVFKVIHKHKLSGSSKNVGDLLSLNESGTRINGLYQTYEEAVEEWNKSVYNMLDFNQSKFEKAKKHFESKIIKK